MGQDIAEYGGVFKVTDGFVERFGKERVRNTPLCESAIVGAALGLSIAGKKAMMEMQFSDFVTVGFNQIVNNLAKIHWRWGQQADVVVRMPTGGNVGAGPFHSQSTEAVFHVPGLKVVYPSTPSDAKLCFAPSKIESGAVFEHKYLYRSLSGPVQRALCHRIGASTHGTGGSTPPSSRTSWACTGPRLQLQLPAPRLKSSIRGRCSLGTKHRIRKRAEDQPRLVLHEDTLTGGIGAELSARIQEACWQDLTHLSSVGGIDTAFPFAGALEEQFLASSRLNEALRSCLGRKASRLGFGNLQGRTTEGASHVHTHNQVRLLAAASSHTTRDSCLLLGSQRAGVAVDDAPPGM